MQWDRPRGNRRSARGGRPRRVHREAQEGEQEEEWPLPIVVVVWRGALARLEEFPERVIFLAVPDPAAPIDVFDQLVLIQVPIKHICVVRVEFLNEPLEHGMIVHARGTVNVLIRLVEIVPIIEDSRKKQSPEVVTNRHSLFQISRNYVVHRAPIQLCTEEAFTPVRTA